MAMNFRYHFRQVFPVRPVENLPIRTGLLCASEESEFAHSWQIIGHAKSRPTATPEAPSLYKIP
jgi:hypothetical protein